MKSKVDKAIESFRSGLNCSQSVLTAYTDDFKVDNGLALSISCGFGAGMGRLQETCGAVTGAYMAIGIYNCQKYTDNKDRKEKTYAMMQRFSDKFKSINGATDCKTLISCDLKTEEGRKLAHDNHLFEKVCEKCISDAVGIVDEVIKE
jgi:C_GCAxxG_C_C family probable redox protein